MIEFQRSKQLQKAPACGVRCRITAQRSREDFENRIKKDVHS